MYSSYTDEQLIQKIALGHKLMFKELVARYKNKLFGTCYRMLQNAEAAEDATQEIFIKIWQNAAKLDFNRASFSTWVYRVAINAATDAKRKIKDEFELVTDIASDDADQIEQLHQQQQEQQIKQAISKLPANQQKALVLCFYQGLSNKQAAEILKNSVKGVESLLVRAKLNLKKQLGVQNG